MVFIFSSVDDPVTPRDMAFNRFGTNTDTKEPTRLHPNVLLSNDGALSTASVVVAKACINSTRVAR